MFFCPYCGKEKADSEKSDEHVLPKAIGGNLEPRNPFKLYDVCQRCNTLAGAYVDGSFIRSWFIQNARALNASRYIDLSANPVLPLSYMGPMPDLDWEVKICELWLGPTGDRIYHFHDPYPEEPYSQVSVGPPLGRRKEDIDPGFVFIFVRATNRVWHPTIFLSLVAHFEDATFYLGNKGKVEGGGFKEIPPPILDLHQKLTGMEGKWHKGITTVHLNFEIRFLAKLGLGLGSLFLDESFARSEDAKTLRKLMWNKNIASLKESEILIAPIFGSQFDNIMPYLAWEAGHVIMMLPFRRDHILAFFAIFYGQLTGGIQISSDANHWSGEIDKDGSVFVIAPGLRRVAGPVNLLEFLAARKGDLDCTHPLMDLLRTVDELPPPPPFEIKQE